MKMNCNNIYTAFCVALKTNGIESESHIIISETDNDYRKQLDHLKKIMASKGRGVQAPEISDHLIAKLPFTVLAKTQIDVLPN